MTTYTDEVNIYNTDAIQDGIDGAATTASNYITEVSGNNGIVVADQGSGTVNGSIAATTTGWHLSDVLEYIRQGVSRFWIGLKNAGDTTPTVRIGKEFVNGAPDNESRMELDYHSLQLMDKEGSAYFHVSDLRDASGEYNMEAVFQCDGSQGVFFLPAVAVDANWSHTIYDDSDNDVTSAHAVREKDNTSIMFERNIPNGYRIEASFTTRDPLAKALTFGSRGSLQTLGSVSSVFGYQCDASGYATFAAGHVTQATGRESSAFGNFTTASGDYSHAEGSSTTASGYIAHAEGASSAASGTYSHAEGTMTTASGRSAHAEGEYTVAQGDYSHAQNYGTRAYSDNQTAIGKYNKTDSNNAYALIIGNGSNSSRSDALTVDWNGNAAIAGELTDMSGNQLYADESHVHSCSDITSGTLADARLPTKGSAGTAGTSSATSGVSIAIPYLTTDEYGRVTGKGTHTHTVNSIPIANISSDLGAEVEKDISSNVSCAASAYTALGSITLTPGKWVITGCIAYASAGAGMRYASISGNSGTTAPSALEQRKCTEYIYMGGTGICRLNVHRIVSISANTNYYLKAYQTTSAAINATGNLHAIRIK